MTKKKKRTIIILSALAAVLLALVIYIIWGNTALMINEITVKSDSLPQSFDGYRIAHVSDLHNDQLGENNIKLIETIKQADPDIIAITGDLVDCHRTNVEVALDFARQAVKIAPCYYVNGNHEGRVPEDYEVLKAGLEEMGVTVLENESLELEASGETINLIGVSDPGFETDYLTGDTEGVMRSHLDELMTEDESFNLLLSHRPELFEVYVDYDADLVLSGHAHGGQFRLPFIGGLYAPNQWFFPEYDAGLYTEDNTNMIVSRGLGNSLFPFRFNNRPEVILVELKSDL